jgi:manganese/zinc/iron transport system substrate-binding protein
MWAVRIKNRDKDAFLFGVITICALAWLVSGCGNSTASKNKATFSGEYPYKVVTTVGMVTDIVRQVAGGKAEVSGIIGAGIDPHLYRPTRNDVASLMSADVVFYSGLMLEGKMADTLVKVARGGKPVHAVTELIEEEYLLSPEGMQGHHDPHVWMDVAAWSKAVEVVAAALSKFDPANAAFYKSNSERYRADQAEVDAYAKTILSSIPKQQRILVTAHDAFNYFGRAYGLEVMGIQGLSTESEAGLEDINTLVDTLVSRGIKAVFVETSVADKNVRALIEGAKSRGHDVVVGGELFSDAMGEPGTYEGTYAGMIDHNATTIARALGGTAPEKGMQGKMTLKQ